MKTMLKPNYQVELVVKDRSHFYRVTRNGKEILLPGVTGVLSIIGGQKTQLLMGWAKKEALKSVRRELLAVGVDPVVLEPDFIDGILDRAKKKPDQLKDEAADRGTRIHEKVDAFIKTGIIPALLDDEISGFGNFQNWLAKSGIEIVMGDTAVASIKHGYGGKLDAVGVRNGVYGILDWKTGNAIYAEAALQAGGAYAVAFNETYGLSPEWSCIVRLGKDTPEEFETKEVASLPECFDAFLYAKRLKDSLAKELYVQD